MGLAWAEHLSVGNEMIDSEHKNLIVAVNSVEEAIGTGDRDALSRSFDLLDTCMYTHFRNEEKIAEAVKFPFAQNRLEHGHLLKEMGMEVSQGVLRSIVKTYCHQNLLPQMSSFAAFRISAFLHSPAATVPAPTKPTH